MAILLDEHDAARDVTMRAAEDMPKKYAVVCLHRDRPGEVVLPSSHFDIPYGIIQETATKGALVRVRPLAAGTRSLVLAEGAITMGTRLAIRPYTGMVGPDGPRQFPIGIALEAANAEDDEIVCQLSQTLRIRMRPQP